MRRKIPIIYSALTIINIFAFIYIEYISYCESFGCLGIGIYYIFIGFLSFVLISAGVFIIKPKSIFMKMLTIVNTIPFIFFIAGVYSAELRKREYGMQEANKDAYVERVKERNPLKIDSINPILHRKENGCIYKIEIVVNTSISEAGSYLVTVGRSGAPAYTQQNYSRDVRAAGAYSFVPTYDEFATNGVQYIDVDSSPVILDYIATYSINNGFVLLEKREQPIVISEVPLVICNNLIR